MITDDEWMEWLMEQPVWRKRIPWGAPKWVQEILISRFKKDLLETIVVFLWDEDTEDGLKCSFCNNLAKLQYLPELEENAKPLLFACIAHYNEFVEEVKKRELR